MDKTSYPKDINGRITKPGDTIIRHNTYGETSLAKAYVIGFKNAFGKKTLETVNSKSSATKHITEGTKPFRADGSRSPFLIIESDDGKLEWVKK